MLNTEEMANKIASKVAIELKYDNSQQAVIAYGLYALLQIILSIVLVCVFGLVFGVLVESLIVAFTIAILRKYSGGAHASSAGMCAFIGTLVAIGLSFIIVRIEIRISIVILLGFLVFSYALYIIDKLVPVDSVAKPIRKEEKRKRLKKQSILVLGIYLIIVMIMLGVHLKMNSDSLIHYILCIYLGIIWQIGSLTSGGHTFLAKMEDLFNNIFSLLRRKV